MNKIIMDALHEVKPNGPEGVKVRYGWVNAENFMVEQEIVVSDLRNDWYGECEHCPENDTPLTVLSIGGIAIPKEELARVTFEKFMRAVEKTWSFKQGRKSRNQRKCEK